MKLWFISYDTPESIFSDGNTTIEYIRGFKAPSGYKGYVIANSAEEAQEKTIQFLKTNKDPYMENYHVNYGSKYILEKVDLISSTVIL